MDKASEIVITQAIQGDIDELFELYTQLHGNTIPEMDERVKEIIRHILADPDYHLLIGRSDGRLVASVSLVVIPNLTHSQRPYALVENVITDEAYRGLSYATILLEAARAIAVSNHCYKIMLMTGSKSDKTLAFYERAGYNRQDKTAFIQWLS